MNLTDELITGSGSVRLSSRFQEIQFELVFGNADTAFTEEEAIASCRNVLFSIEMQSEIGPKTVIYPTSLLTLLEISSILSKGAVRVTKDGNAVSLRGVLSMGVDGDIVPKPLEYYTLKVSGLAADVTCYLGVLDTGVNSYLIREYKPFNIAAKVPTPVPVKEADLLAIPKANLQLVELEYPGMKKQALLPRELEQRLSEKNPLSFNIGGLITPVGLDYYTTPVMSAEKAYITSTVETIVMIVKTQPV